ncbi:hypothetical protein VDG1235_1365 [Verrucomicrobiia bacterium DG1235]|nr:hypothetical protein VDG1235_1365 [Verrucomicrobiae bacterium DG1235]
MSRSKLSKPWLLIALIALYSLGHLLWYMKTPLGLSPVLDGRENLILAQKIANGSLEPEPFFRAMLYPAIIAFFPLGHSLLGFFCHLINSGLSMRIARRLWKNDTAGLLAGAFVGFNPVLLHYAFDPLDATLAITFFLASLAAFQKSLTTPAFDKQGATLAATAGLFISLAAITRPHFLLTLLVLIFLATIATAKKRFPFNRLVSFISALALPLLALGFTQQHISGSFRIIPWQGAYNLYTSNNHSANGLYYQQKLSFQNLGEHQNPNRLEEAELYKQEHDKLDDISTRSSYWRSRTLESISEKPLKWLKLEAFKLYAALNNFEQYNNKTYSFHKSLSPWLQYNPLGWGTLLAIASFCGATLWLQMKGHLWPLLIIASSILAGLLIFMASGRFRLPLVPLLAIIAAVFLSSGPPSKAPPGNFAVAASSHARSLSRSAFPNSLASPQKRLTFKTRSLSPTPPPESVKTSSPSNGQATPLSETPISNKPSACA